MEGTATVMTKATSSTPEQRAAVVPIIASGVLTTVLIAFLSLYVLSPGTEQQFPSSQEKLVYTIRWQSVSIFTLLFGILKVGSGRYSTTAFDPISGKGEHFIAVDVRYLQNTMEQFILNVLGQLILSTYLSASALPRVIPLLVTLFVLARIVFYIGYRKDPIYRGAGFAMTLFPNVLMHLYCLFCFMFY